MAFGPDIEWANPAPAFSGGQFDLTFSVPDLKSGKDIALDMTTGAYDAFLGDAITGYTIRQNRGPNGQYLPGFSVVFTFRRPAEGEVYTLGESFLVTP